MTPSECARALAAPFGVDASDDSFVVARAGQRVRVTVTSNSGTIHAVVVTAFGAALPAVAFTRESSFDRLGKRLGIAREAQLGDASFDPQVYVDSSLDDAHVRVLLASPVARETVLALLRTCDRVEFGEAGVVTTTSNERFFVNEHARLFEHLEQVCSLQGVLPVVPAELVRDARVASVAVPIGFAIGGTLAFTGLLIAAFAVCGSAGLFAPYRLAAIGIGLAAAAWVVILPFAVLLLSGRSSSFRTVVGFGSASFFVLLPVGPIALCVANESRDVSAETEHRMPIVRAYMESSDDDEQLFLEFVSPVDPANTVTLGFDGVAPPPPGTVVTIRTREGGLGFPRWVGAHYGP